MDFLSPTIAQIRELFASMTPGARVTAGLLVAVVLVSLGFLFQKATAGPDEYLFGGEPIGRAHLPRMEAAIAATNIDYEIEGNRIKVARTDRNAAVAAIADKGELPPEFHHLMKEALNSGHMFDFRGDKEMRYRQAREAQASLILSEFPWVETANVIYNVRQTSGLSRKRKSSAAVTVKPAVGEAFDSRRMRSVKDFVSKACDVPLDSIAVTNLGSDLGAGDGDISPDDFDSPFYKLKAQEERKIRGSIVQQLEFIPGVKVQVNAQLDPVSEKRIVQVKPDEQPVALRKQTAATSDKKVVGLAGDRVGLEAQGPQGIGRDEALARQDTSEKTSDSNDTRSVVGSTTTQSTIAAFALKEADASVAVPLSYVEAVFRRENLTPDGEEPETIDPQALEQKRSEIATNIEELVQPLLPKLALGQDEYAQVNVRFFRDLPPPTLPEPSLAKNAIGYLGQYGNTLAMTGLAIFSLVMLRSMVNSSGKDGPVSGLPSLQLDGETLHENSADDDEGEEARPKLKLRKADTLKDDLTEMVGSDPDAAAAILKSWINNAA